MDQLMKKYKLAVSIATIVVGWSLWVWATGQMVAAKEGAIKQRISAVETQVSTNKIHIKDGRARAEEHEKTTSKVSADLGIIKNDMGHMRRAMDRIEKKLEGLN